MESQAAGTSEPTPTSSVTDTFEPVTDVRTLRYAIERDPAGITPGFTTDAEGDLVVDALFDSLTAIDDGLRVVPSAASSWTVSEDQRTWTFTLRAGGRFHDEAPVTARDFVRSFVRIADGTAAGRSLSAARLADVRGYDAAQLSGEPLAGVMALDDRTLVIELDRPDPDLPRRMAHPTLGPVPQEASLTPLAFSERPVGNGPFRMAAPWEHNQFIRLARVPGHPDVPGVDEIVFRIYAGSGSQAERDLDAGLVDVATLPVTALSAARQRLGRGVDGAVGPGVLDRASTSIYYLGVNTTRPPFDDVRMRRAVSLVIDRAALVELTQDTRVALTAIVPPGVPGARVDVCEHCRRDLDAARDLVAAVRLDLQAAVLEGEEAVDGEAASETPSEPAPPPELPAIVLRHDQGVTNTAIMNEIAADLRRELDLKVEVVAAPLDEHVVAVAAGEAHLFRLGWQGDLSLRSFLEPLVRTGSIDNLTRYSRPEVDALLDQAALTPDPAARTALFQQVEDLVLADAPILPVHVYRHRLAVSTDVEGFVLRADGSVDLTAVRVERSS